MNKIRVAVVGGGAAGMIAAIAAAKYSDCVTIYERNDRLGKKILATGNGRCNLSNVYADVENYHGNDVGFMKNIIDEFWVGETLDLFYEMGLIYKTEDEGKVYPFSNHAASVLDILRFEIDRVGIKTEYGFEVQKVEKIRDEFKLTSYKSESAYADRVIVTTGGKANPASGSNGSGYTLLENFGHKKTRLFPSLVQIKLKNSEFKSLTGLKIDGAVCAKKGKTILKREQGEILFTDYGISGPAVFAVSRFAGEDNNCEFEIDMVPEYGVDDLVNILNEHKRVMSCVEEVFVGFINKRIGQMIIKCCTNLKMNDDINKLTDSDIVRMAEKLKKFTVISDGTMSWNNAQVTAGGIETSGFSDKTLESKLVKGIYAAGEILDIDGDCGGYNLQWAWSSGYIAGSNAAREYEK